MLQSRALTIGLLPLVALLAGCAGAGFGEDGTTRVRGADGATDAAGRPLIPADWADIALTGGEGHNHRDPRHHQNLSTPNFELIGYEPLITDWHGRTTGDYFCGDTKEKGDRRLSVVHSFGSDVAFVLIDTTDPTQPRKIGELVMGNTQVYDVTLTTGLDFVLLSTSPMDSGPDVESVASVAYGPIVWRDACTGQTTPVDGPEAGLPYASGIVLVDIANPRNPVVVDFRSFPVMGGHSVRAQVVGGQELILVSVPNVGPYVSYYALMDIETVSGRAVMQLLSVYQLEETEGAVPGVPLPTPAGMHDGYMQDHPVTGQALAYLAYGNRGLVIVDITDPTLPQFVSHYNDHSVLGDAAPPGGGYFHEALPIEGTWDGRHYTFIGEECVGHRPTTPTCLVITLDTTDPANPTFVGAWTLPVDVQWERGLQYSLHYLALVDRTLFVSVYHGGVWAVDVSTPEALRYMPSIGAYLPAEESPAPAGKTPRSLVIQQLYGGYALDDAPIVLDLDPTSDGDLVIFDATSGLYVVRFDATRPAPSPLPWPLAYNADVAGDLDG